MIGVFNTKLRFSELTRQFGKKLPSTLLINKMQKDVINLLGHDLHYCLV